MWTDEQRRRYHFLSERHQANELRPDEAAELAALVRQLDDDEARYLAPANERKAQEAAAMSAAIGRLETENRQLRHYLDERLAFLERVKALVASLQAEDQEMRERLATVLTPGDDPTSRSSP
jgi:metal-dependent amidase/aminoacylase/carboxypeptidase family protein